MPTLQWLAARDVHAEAVTACYHVGASELAVVGSERDAAVWLAEERGRQVAALQRRPQWGTVAAAGVAGAAAGAVALGLLVR